MKHKMAIYIVSRSRWDKQVTLESLGKHGERACIVVPQHQRNEYARAFPDDVVAMPYIVPCPYEGIARTRAFCGGHAWNSMGAKKFVMFDDDLKFFYRQHPDTPTLLKSASTHITGMLKFIEDMLDKYAHVAVSARQGNNYLSYPGVECSRPLRVLAYQTEKFLECEHGRVAIMEDFDVTLQLLRKGYPNYVISSWAQDQGQTQAKGGCSDYRDHAVHEENAKKLAELHHPFVKLRQKENKTGGEFGKRTEVTVYWRKAYLASQKHGK